MTISEAIQKVIEESELSKEDAIEDVRICPELYTEQIREHLTDEATDDEIIYGIEESLEDYDEE